MESEKFSKALEIQRDIDELKYFRTLLDSYFSSKEIRAEITIKYDGTTQTMPYSNIDKKSPQDGLCSNYKHQFLSLVAQLINEKENEFKNL